MSASSLLPYTGVVALLAVGVPAVWSLCVLARLEAERSNTANRLQFARNLVGVCVCVCAQAGWEWWAWGGQKGMRHVASLPTRAHSHSFHAAPLLA